MKTNHLIWISVAVVAISTAPTGHAQVAVAPTPTIWRFMGIPQGIQKIRDVTVNRRGNRPGLERKPPLKRIGDPANLESENPAIKAAAEVKQAEDMKAQKIKAIKYLAEMGCGCYDQEGKITDALIAAMDDCTPDVRLAAIEAIETTASGECCKKCGSTSCCSEKVTKRLSEIAYERDDTGCRLEPNAEIRQAAARALNICCPNRATGPIEEDVPELPEPVPVPPKPIQGEGPGDLETIEGEGEAIDQEAEMTDEGADSTSPDVSTAAVQEEATEEATEQEVAEVQEEKPTDLLLLRSAKAQVEPVGVELGKVKMIGGMAIQPVTISPVAATAQLIVTKPQVDAPISLSLRDKPAAEASPSTAEATSRPTAASDSLPSPATLPSPVTLPAPIALPIKGAAKTSPRSPTAKPIQRKQTVAMVVGVDHRSGRVMLRSGQALRPEASVTVYHQYLTGERLVAHLLIKSVNGSQAVAMITDRSGLSKIQSGDRAICY